MDVYDINFEKLKSAIDLDIKFERDQLKEHMTRIT